MRLIVCCVAAVLTLTTGTAVAETWSGKDRSGDVRNVTFSLKPKPCGTLTVTKRPDNKTSDIIALTVDHGVEAVVVEVTLRDLKKRQLFDASFNVRTPGPGFVISIDRFKANGRIDTFFTKEPKPVQPDECGFAGYASVGMLCDGLEGAADPVTNVLRVTVPRECLKSPDWVRVGASMQSLKEPYPYDQWGRRGDRPKNNLLVGPLSPRVHADAP